MENLKQPYHNMQQLHLQQKSELVSILKALK